MKKINPLKLAIVVLGFSTVASLVGSISGTVAWYAYSTRALVSYKGTSVQSSTQLQIGIRSNRLLEKFEEGGAYHSLVERVDVDDYFCYFTHLGSGGMPSTIIREYLENNNYATNTLEPVSTYTYNIGDSFLLKNCPTTNKPLERSNAPTTKFVKIPFVFRVFSSGDNGIANRVALGNKKIYLSNAVTQSQLSETGAIDSSIRLHIDRNGKDSNNNDLTDFVLNPNSAENGATKVAGVLDLSGNGYFDYENNPANEETYLHEFIYGDYSFKNGVDWDDCVEQTVVDDNVYDVNTTGITNVGTTFTSKHRQDIFHFNCAGTSNKKLEDYININKAEFLGTNAVYPTKQNGVLSGNNYVCETDDSTEYKLGSFDLTIYIEGWDFSTINQHSNKEFNLGLTFEINAAN